MGKKGVFDLGRKILKELKKRTVELFQKESSENAGRNTKHGHLRRATGKRAVSKPARGRFSGVQAQRNRLFQEERKLQKKKNCKGKKGEANSKSERGGDTNA